MNRNAASGPTTGRGEGEGKNSMGVVFGRRKTRLEGGRRGYLWAASESELKVLRTRKQEKEGKYWKRRV